MRAFVVLLALTALTACGAEGPPFVPTSSAAAETAAMTKSAVPPEMTP